MKSIDERIIEHEKLIRKIHDKQDEIEKILNQINEKLIFHNVAIQNLKIKKAAFEQNK